MLFIALQGVSLVPTTAAFPQKTCVAVGMFSRSTDFEIRQWHREKFRVYSSSNQVSGSVDMHMRFGMGAPVAAVMERVDEESKLHHDILIYGFQEAEECLAGNRCLRRNHDSLRLAGRVQQPCTTLYSCTTSN